MWRACSRVRKKLEKDKGSPWALEARTRFEGASGTSKLVPFPTLASAAVFRPPAKQSSNRRRSCGGCVRIGETCGQVEAGARACRESRACQRVGASTFVSFAELWEGRAPLEIGSPIPKLDRRARGRRYPRKFDAGRCGEHRRKTRRGSRPCDRSVAVRGRR